MRPGAIAVAFAVTYPLLLLAGVALGLDALRLAGLVALALAMLLPGLVAGRPGAWIGAATAMATLYWLASRNATMLPLLLAPALIPAGVAWIFGRTLLRGRVPLIVAIVRHLHAGNGPEDPARIDYARRLTIVWTGLLAALAITNLVLGALVFPGGLCELFGIPTPIGVPEPVWAAWTGVAGYLVMAIFFLAEYAYRQRRFPDQPYDGLLDFLRRSMAAAPAIVMDRELPPSGGGIHQ